MAQTIYLARPRTSDKEIQEEKKCSGKCGEVKPLEDYPKEPRNADGHAGQCKDCKNAKQNEKSREKKAEWAMYGIF